MKEIFDALDSLVYVNQYLLWSCVFAFTLILLIINQKYKEIKSKRQKEDLFTIIMAKLNTAKSIDDINAVYPLHLKFTLLVGSTKDYTVEYLARELLLKRAEFLKKMS